MAVNLQLGKSYERRDGAIVEIREIVQKKPGYKAPTQPYKCSEGKQYSANGCWKKDGTRHEHDLIREHVTTQRRSAAEEAPTRQRSYDSYSAPRPPATRTAPAAPAYAAVVEEPKKVNNKMNKLFSRMFGGEIGQVTDTNFKMSFRGAAVRQADGGYAAYDPAVNAMTDVTEFLIDADDFLYKLPTTTVKAGDCVVISEAPLDAIYVTAVEANGEIRGLNPRSNRIEIYQPRTNMFGIKFFITLTSLVDFNNIAGGNAGLGGILPLLMLSGGLGGSKKSGSKDDKNSLLPLLLLSGGLGAQPGAAGVQGNALLPLMLMGGGLGDEGGLSQLLMFQAMSGAAGGGLGGLFGGAAPAAAPAAPQA